jgi:hypothetical protein
MVASWRQSYDRVFQLHEKPSAFWKQDYFSLLRKNALAYYNAGVVDVNLEFVGYVGPWLFT